MSTSYDSQANSGAATVSPQAGTVQIGEVATPAANLQTNGATFDYGAFSALVVPTAGNFADIYDGGGDTSVSFYQFQGTAPSGGWLPLGDIVAVEGTPLPASVLLFAPGSDPAAFANPTGFNWLLDDAGSGNPNDLVYWGPVAPAGYVSLGICFTNNGDDLPNPANYWCINASYVLPVAAAVAWNDAGAGWDNDGNLLAPAYTPTAPEIAPPGSVLILPPTLGSAQAGYTPYALVGALCAGGGTAPARG